MASYNPYNAVKSISDLKGKYHTAKELGGDYAQYQNEAVKYYDELRKNGQQGVADELAASDYIKSLDILGRYKADTSVDDFYDSLTKIGTGETAPKASETVTDMLDAWKGADDVRVDLTADHYKTGKDQLDRINNFDYTEQPYYKPIMETYNLYGDNAADGELAVGAGANGGNIDSYAAANAARQQLAFTNAGHQAALAAAQQNQGNWTDLYEIMGGNITDMGAINAENLGTIAGMYGVDSAERQNALNLGAGLISQDKQNEIDRYLADIGLEGTKYTTDAQERMNTENVGLERYLGELGYNSDLAGYAAQERMNASDNATARYGYDTDAAIAAANNDADLERLLAQLESEERINTANNTAARAQQHYANKYATEQAERDHQNALDELYAKNNLVRDTTTYTPEQAGTVVYNGILEGAEEFSDIKSFEDLYSYVAQISGDPTGSAKVVKSIKEQHPKLFGGSAASGSQTFDGTALLK